MSSDIPAQPDPKQIAFKVEFDFYAVIGRFVTSFAAAEVAAHVALRAITGLSDENARIIFGGMRFSDVSERLRKLSLETPNRKEIEGLLSHMSAISIVRDRLAHRFTYIDQDNPPPVAVISNHWNAKVFHSAETHKYEAKDFFHMMADCDAIMIRFMIVAHGPEIIADIPQHEARDPFEPWLYKPLSQGRKHRENCDDP